MKLDRKDFSDGAEFYETCPTGQYDKEAEHALDNFFSMLDALKAVQKVLPVMPPDVWAKVNGAVANAEDTGE